ncbi:MAG: hypothetical protein HZA53_16995 [Planctomycetes bacterium]|nr:hypothetical protein [Planctomycetota bacterium]
MSRRRAGRGPRSTLGSVARRALAACAALAGAETARAQCHAWTGGFAAPSALTGEPYTLFVAVESGAPRLYLGGLFPVPGGGGPNVARWDGANWSALGGGTNDAVLALARHDDGAGAALFAGGSVTTAGGAAAPGLARWNGSAWSSVGGGVSGGFATVLALCAHDDGTGPALYAGGAFAFAGGVPAANVARWNGNAWSAVGGGTNDRVLALLACDLGTGPELYASGWFIQAGGAPANGIARWNGSAWSPLGAGTGGGARALCAFDEGTGTRLFAAGGSEFLARWDGSAWSSVGGGLSNVVNALVVHDDASGPALYAGGSFLSAGGASARHVARWTGGAWSRLRAGLDTPMVAEVARALASFPIGVARAADLCVAGTFTQAALLPASRLAAWRGCASPVDAFCPGDGSLTDCPCSNRGSAGRGCAWHAEPAGALLETLGSPATDDVLLRALSMPTAGTSIFLKGAALDPSGAAFGDGLLCLGGALLRLGTTASTAGTAQYPSLPGITLSARSGVLPGSGVVAYYQTWYRNAASFCTSATSNATNGVRVVW